MCFEKSAKATTTPAIHSLLARGMPLEGSGALGPNRAEPPASGIRQRIVRPGCSMTSTERRFGTSFGLVSPRRSEWKCLDVETRTVFGQHDITEGADMVRAAALSRKASTAVSSTQFTHEVVEVPH